MADNNKTFSVSVKTSSPSSIRVMPGTVQNGIIAKGDTSLYYANLARNWAISPDLVQNEDYSSKYYAGISKDNADLAKEYSESAELSLTSLDTLITDYNDNFQNAVSTALSDVEEAKTSTLETISTAETTAVTAVTTAQNTAVSTIEELETSTVNSITTIKSDAITEVTTTTATAKTELNTLTTTLISNITEISTSTQTDIQTKADNAISEVDSAISNMEGNVTSALESVETSVSTAQTELTEFIEENISTAQTTTTEIVETAIESIQAAADDYLVDGVVYHQDADITANLEIISADCSWGNITGNITDQTDLKTALDAKANVDDMPEIPVASETAAGVVKVDGATITIDDNGVISLGDEILTDRIYLPMFHNYPTFTSQEYVEFVDGDNVHYHGGGIVFNNTGNGAYYFKLTPSEFCFYPGSKIAGNYFNMEIENDRLGAYIGKSQLIHENLELQNLQTNSKTIIGAINELKERLDSLGA